MAVSTATKNMMIDALLQGAQIYISLHTADPGTTGSNELSGGSYSRSRPVSLPHPRPRTLGRRCGMRLRRWSRR